MSKETSEPWFKSFVKSWELTSKLDSDHTWWLGLVMVRGSHLDLPGPSLPGKRWAGRVNKTWGGKRFPSKHQCNRRNWPEEKKKSICRTLTKEFIDALNAFLWEDCSRYCFWSIFTLVCTTYAACTWFPTGSGGAFRMQHIQFKGLNDLLPVINI